MTPERYEEIVSTFIAWKEDGEARGIPQMYVEFFTECAWQIGGYQTWDEFCGDRLGGWRMALPRPDRQQAAVEMAGAGMSTRAIGSALGVHHSTVAEDLSGVGNPTPANVTGLDGKTYKRPNVADTEPQWSADELVLRARLETDPDLTVVVNIRNAHNLIAWADRGDRYVRVDRQTKWGNPFILGRMAATASAAGNAAGSSQ